MFDKTVDALRISHELGEVLEWKKYIPLIPFIEFGAGLEVKVIPPRTGAMVRFLVKKKGGNKEISVYLDCHSLLGFMDSPYWEAYEIEGDTMRFDMSDTKSLVKVIRKELNKKG